MTKKLIAVISIYLIFIGGSISGPGSNSITLSDEIKNVIYNLDRAKFNPVRKGWQFDYGFSSGTGMLNTFEYLRSLMSFAFLQNMLPMNIYLSGPHSSDQLDLTNPNDFGHYNPEFVRYFHSVIASIISDRSFITSTQEMMNKYGIITNLKGLQDIYRLIEQDRNSFQKYKSEYQQLLHEHKWPEGGYRDHLPKELDQDKYWNWSETNYYFWIRRDIDGTMELWINIINDILDAYLS